jgi:catechol 2,3-dioxygenase-like lactoylglutathione lyase family enzyme
MTQTQAALQGTISVALTASDLNRSIEFYTKGLGFHEDERMEDNGKLQGVLLSAGGAHLGISQDDFSKGRDRKKGIGLSVHVETDQDIGALAQRAKKAGLRLDHEPGPLPWGPNGFSLKDPDGFTVFVSNPA